MSSPHSLTPPPSGKVFPLLTVGINYTNYFIVLTSATTPTTTESPYSNIKKQKNPQKIIFSHRHLSADTMPFGQGQKFHPPQNGIETFLLLTFKDYLQIMFCKSHVAFIILEISDTQHTWPEIFFRFYCRDRSYEYFETFFCKFFNYEVLSMKVF